MVITPQIIAKLEEWQSKGNRTVKMEFKGTWLVFIIDLEITGCITITEENTEEDWTKLLIQERQKNLTEQLCRLGERLKQEA